MRYTVSFIDELLYETIYELYELFYKLYTNKLLLEISCKETTFKDVYKTDIFVKRITVFEIFSVSAKHARENLYSRILSETLSTLRDISIKYILYNLIIYICMIDKKYEFYFYLLFHFFFYNNKKIY